MEKTLRGRCLCGAVEYQVPDALKYAGYCYSSECRRFSGSAFSAFGGISEADPEVLKGERQIASYRKSSGSRGRVLRFALSENQVQINKTQGPALKAHGVITVAGFLPSGWQCSGNPVGCRLGAEACCWRFWERESHLP